MYMYYFCFIVLDMMQYYVWASGCTYWLDSSIKW